MSRNQNRISFCLACTGGSGTKGGKDLSRVLNLRGKQKKPILIPVFVEAYTASEIPPTTINKSPLAYAERLVNPQNISENDFSKTLFIDGIQKPPFLKEGISFPADVPDNNVLDVNVPAGRYEFESSGWWYKIPIEEQQEGRDIRIRFGGKNMPENFETEVEYVVSI